MAPNPLRFFGRGLYQRRRLNEQNDARIRAEGVHQQVQEEVNTKLDNNMLNGEEKEAHQLEGNHYILGEVGQGPAGPGGNMGRIITAYS